MKFNDAITGTAVLLFAILVFAAARSFPSISADQIGPALFPQIIATGLTFCGLVLVATGLRRRKAEPWIEIPAWLHVPRQTAGFAIVTGGLLAFCVYLERLGFLVCAPLLLAVLLLMLRVRKWVVPLLAIGISLLIHAIFYKGLGVPLPWGLLTSWAW
ncbi:MAG TPA: tripartite tricarboxylate transporter TctB family protein [Burkholderiales bacterium]|jgi:putative tricarboxylic transport membrane protein|nr:tripartite tricarboxylate transporter TctB family protein [Burkholderiales bacterium]